MQQLTTQPRPLLPLLQELRSSPPLLRPLLLTLLTPTPPTPVASNPPHTLVMRGSTSVRANTSSRVWNMLRKATRRYPDPTACRHTTMTQHMQPVMATQRSVSLL